MQVATNLEDVAFSEGIAGQAHIAVSTPQGRALYEVMSVILSSYHYTKNETDIGALETM